MKSCRARETPLIQEGSEVLLSLGAAFTGTVQGYVNITESKPAGSPVVPPSYSSAAGSINISGLTTDSVAGGASVKCPVLLSEANQPAMWTAPPSQMAGWYEHIGVSGLAIDSVASGVSVKTPVIGSGNNYAAVTVQTAVPPTASPPSAIARPAPNQVAGWFEHLGVSGLAIDSVAGGVSVKTPVIGSGNNYAAVTVQTAVPPTSSAIAGPAHSQVAGWFDHLGVSSLATNSVTGGVSVTRPVATLPALATAGPSQVPVTALDPANEEFAAENMYSWSVLHPGNLERMKQGLNPIHDRLTMKRLKIANNLLEQEAKRVNNQAMP